MQAGYIGLDVGTGGTRGALVDSSGRAVAVAERTYMTSFPRPLWAEQDPDDWQRAALGVLTELSSQARDHGAEVQAVGLTGQMHGAVLLDRGDRPVVPAMIWMDQRSHAEALELDTVLEEAGLRHDVLNPGLPNMTATKILWLLHHEPRTHARVAHLLLPKDYVRLALTGEHATDVSDASGTLLLDVRGRAWSTRMADAVGLAPEALPGLYESSAVSGTLTASVAAAVGLPPGIPVAGGAGDQAAGARAAGLRAPGPLMVSLGTSGVVFGVLTEPMPSHMSLHSFCHASRGAWHWMGVTQSAGGSLKWLRDSFFPHVPYAELDNEAATVAPGAGGLVFLPYLMGERAPLVDPKARGGFVGLTLGHGRPQLVRAVLEGVAMSLRSVLDVAPVTAVEEVRVTGGGAKSELWLNILAGVLGVPVVRVTSPEGPAFGAAVLAGEAVGAETDEWPRTEVVADLEAATRRSDAYQGMYRAYREMYPALKPTFDRLAVVAEAGGLGS